MRHSLGGRIELGARVYPPLERVVDYEIQRVEAWNIIAVNARRFSVRPQMTIPFAHCFSRQCGLQIGQKFRFPRNDGNVEQMAFVTATRPREPD